MNTREQELEPRELGKDLDESGNIIKQPVPEEKPVSLDEAVSMFEGAIEIKSIDEIASIFREKMKENRICLSIPVEITSEENRGEELLRIGAVLRTAIFEYTGLDRTTDIGSGIKWVIGEITSNVGKHTVLNDQFKTIFVLAEKNGFELSFHLANPALAETNLNEVNQAHSTDEYDEIAHGNKAKEGMEADLIAKGCKKITDKSHKICNSTGECVGVEQDFVAVLDDKLDIAA